jgi:hypothetical protein
MCVQSCGPNHTSHSRKCCHTNKAAFSNTQLLRRLQRAPIHGLQYCNLLGSLALTKESTALSCKPMLLLPGVLSQPTPFHVFAISCHTGCCPPECPLGSAEQGYPGGAKGFAVPHSRTARVKFVCLRYVLEERLCAAGNEVSSCSPCGKCVRWRRGLRVVPCFLPWYGLPASSSPRVASSGGLA